MACSVTEPSPCYVIHLRAVGTMPKRPSRRPRRWITEPGAPPPDRPGQPTDVTFRSCPLRPQHRLPLVVLGAWPARHHLVDQAELPRFLRAHEPITFHGLLD